jgi:hypothetical protein
MAGFFVCKAKSYTRKPEFYPLASNNRILLGGVTMVSRKLRVAIKLSETPAYKIAQAAGENPATLSKLLHGIIPVKPNDPRVIKIGKVLGIPETECFE